MSDSNPEPPSSNGRRLLRELNAKISTMETLLGNLHNTESRTGSSFQAVKVDLRARLTACYLARESLRKGELQGSADLEDLLVRLRVRVEHRKYEDLAVIEMGDVQSVDIEKLAEQFWA